MNSIVPFPITVIMAIVSFFKVTYKIDRDPWSFATLVIDDEGVTKIGAVFYLQGKKQKYGLRIVLIPKDRKLRTRQFKFGFSKKESFNPLFDMKEVLALSNFSSQKDKESASLFNKIIKHFRDVLDYGVTTMTLRRIYWPKPEE